MPLRVFGPFSGGAYYQLTQGASRQLRQRIPDRGEEWIAQKPEKDCAAESCRCDVVITVFEESLDELPHSFWFSAPQGGIPDRCLAGGNCYRLREHGNVRFPRFRDGDERRSGIADRPNERSSKTASA